MTLPTNLTFYMELGLEILLALTLVYCVILERRLASLFGSSALLEMTARDGHTLIAMSLVTT